MIIEIKSRFTTQVIYTHSEENNTVKLTLQAAVKIGANLYGADLRGADFYDANLRSANLYGADLCSANLYGVDLRGADLRSADLRGADLRSANLYGADLRGADFYDANLRGADLRGADLRSANLYGVDLCSADLRGANLYNKEDTIEKLIQITNIGSRGDTTFFFKCQKSVQVKCGCFFGTIEKFIGQVKETHPNDEYGIEYNAAIEFILKVFKQN